MTRRRLLLPFLFAAGVLGLAAATAPPAAAQGQGPSDESFESADGVRLNGRFYQAKASRNGSCVLLLPGFKKDPTKGDWDGLAKRLAGEGYHVLLLHYRGHGKSTDIDGKTFFGHPVLGAINTQFVPGANKKNPPKNSLTMAELKTQYYPMLVNDVMAARSFLERKNDSGEVNASTLYLVGAGDAAPLGLAFIAAEWHRAAQVPNIAVPPQLVSGQARLFPGAAPAGKDIAACVWLSPERPSGMKDAELKGLASYAIGMRTETRMLFLAGEKDDTGKTRAKYFFDEVLVAKGRSGLEKMELTEVRTIKNSKLAGVDLLGKNDQFGTEDIISKYLRAVEDDRKGRARFERKYTAPLPVVLPTFGISP